MVVEIIIIIIFYFIHAKQTKYCNQSKGSKVRTTEPMVSIKVTNCSIQSSRILACDGFAKNYMGLIQKPKSRIFSFSHGHMDKWACNLYLSVACCSWMLWMQRIPKIPNI